MYVPARFAQDDPAALEQAMREIGFAAIVTPMSDEMAISHVPVVIKNDGHRFCTIETHVARANPHWNGIAGAESTAIFQGPFAYISPSWYPSKAEHGKVVPTWNYVAIHASGRFETIEDAGWLRDHLDRLTELNERPRDKPWAVSDAPETFIDGLARAIVGLRMTVKDLQGKWKMSQQRSEADRLGTIAGLEATERGKDVARIMRKLEVRRSI